MAVPCTPSLPPSTSVQSVQRSTAGDRLGALLDIPGLDPAMGIDSPEELPASWHKWGSASRAGRAYGRGVHFYCYDWHFSALWKHPETLERFGPACIVEPNYSTFRGQPLALALADLYRKRWLARRWQEAGIPVLVDLNVDPSFRPYALLGVPRGFPSYATRSHRDLGPEHLQWALDVARRHSGRRDPVLVVYGGGPITRTWCANRELRHVPEHHRSIRGLA